MMKSYDAHLAGVASRRHTLVTAGLAVLLPFGLGGCAGKPVSLTGAPAAQPQLGIDAERYFAQPVLGLLGPDDTISVTVAREPSLSLQSVVIGPDGKFDMPGVGRIVATGKTTAEISDEIGSRLAANYIRHPYVAVNIVQTGSRHVTVDGAVSSPGVYTFNTGATLLDAVAMAKGANRVADLKQVVVFRKIDGAPCVAVFNLKEIRGGRMANPTLLPDDRIVVGFSGFTQAWVDFLSAIPAVAIFTRF